MRSLRSRLFVATLVAVLLSIAVTLVVGAVLVRRSLERSVLTNLGREAALAAVRHENQPIGSPAPRNLQLLLASLGDRLIILRPPFGDTPPLSAEQRQAIETGQPVQGKVTVRGEDFLFAAQPAGGDVVLLLRRARLGAADWRPFLGSFLIAGLVGAALAGIGSFLLARAIARPVGRVAQASRSLAAGLAPGIVPIEGSDELAVLASSFNDMAAQLARAREAERGFLLSVSHELKTPLTAIRGYAEALEEGAVDPHEGAEVLTQEAARLERLVQDLLDLARLNQRTFAVRSVPVDLSGVAREAVRRYDQRAKSFGLELSTNLWPGPAFAFADHDRVLQVVSNLVENALRCTQASGSVTISSRPGAIVVEDSGPGLAPEDIPRALERFFLYGRYGGTRPVGTGLGLAIVKELAEAMGGSVTVESVAGKGSVFTVRLTEAEHRPPRPQGSADRPETAPLPLSSQG
jgi:two-component system OmpR family sensor kinase